jgi:hypothetical protein
VEGAPALARTNESAKADAQLRLALKVVIAHAGMTGRGGSVTIHLNPEGDPKQIEARRLIAL